MSSSPPYQPQDSRAPVWLLPFLASLECPKATSPLGSGHDPLTEQGTVTAPRFYIVCKTKQVQVLCGELGRELLLGSDTQDPQWSSTPPRSSGYSEDWLIWFTDWLIWFTSLGYGCYSDTANHVLRFDLICIESRWLEIIKLIDSACRILCHSNNNFWATIIIISWGNKALIVTTI